MQRSFDRLRAEFSQTAKFVDSGKRLRSFIDAAVHDEYVDLVSQPYSPLQDTFQRVGTCAPFHARSRAVGIRDLFNLQGPSKVWTWDPLHAWHRYRLELYPHSARLSLGSGIANKQG